MRGRKRRGTGRGGRRRERSRLRERDSLSRERDSLSRERKRPRRERDSLSRERQIPRSRERERSRSRERERPRSRERERSRSRDRERPRFRERDSLSRDRERPRFRERDSLSRERERPRSRERERSRSRERERPRSRERERSRSRDQKRSRSRDRERSRSRDRERSRSREWERSRSRDRERSSSIEWERSRSRDRERSSSIEWERSRSRDRERSSSIEWERSRSRDRERSSSREWERSRSRDRERSRSRRRNRPRSRRRNRPRSRRRDRPEAKVEDKDLDVNADVNAYFVGNVSVEQHYKGQNQNKERYAAGMAVLGQNGVEIVQNAKIRALAAAWARNDFTLANAFLLNRDNFGLVEVLKALQLLDAGRQIRVKEKQMKRLQVSKNKVFAKTLGRLKSDIDNLNAFKSPYGSASGAVCKHIRRWVKTFTKEDLEFYALHLPKKPWKKLADICHLHPEKDFPNLTWFLPYCFGKPVPEETMIHHCRQITAANVNELLEKFPIPYSHIKQYRKKLTRESKRRISQYEKKLDTLLWYYEDLKCEKVDEVILKRLEAGEAVTLPNGKLIDRLLMMKMYRDGIPQRSYYGQEVKRKEDPKKAPFLSHLVGLGDKILKDISLPLETPIVVSGDASGSMDIAIRTSSIIAGLLTALCSAKLVFFDNEIRYPDILPTNIHEVLELAITTKTGGATSPAASLYPYYQSKEVIKTFIMVTDEKENTDCKGYNFDELYQKYHDEVYPARLVFVSFLHDQHSQGDMVRKLEARGFKPMQFKFHQSQPDLTKLDKLFGLLSTETDSYENEIDTMEKKIRDAGLADVFQHLKWNTKP